jgi:hypothetical protein
MSLALVLASTVVGTGCGGGADVPAARGRASSEATVAPVPLLVLGDSLTVGARLYGGLGKALAAGGWEPEIVAEDGRAVEWGLDQVRGRGAVPPVVVVGFGTNPGSAPDAFGDWVLEMVAELTDRGARTVLWWEPPAAGAADRGERAAALRAAAGGALVVPDWPAELARHADWLGPDGIHYTDAGYEGLADFIRRRVAPYAEP